MARNLRLDVPGIPFHIVQRGVDRAACFRDDRDREFYLASLCKAAGAYECQIHAYVLMTNHVHLLATASGRGGLSSMMQNLGRRYVRRFNSRYHRTGTLWEGRYRSSPVDTDLYLLTCYRYIELNPVRARMVQHAIDYRWSSARCNAQGQVDALIAPHATYLALSDDSSTRHSTYRAILEQAVSHSELAAIRENLKQGKALGSRRFQERIEELTGRSAIYRQPGRPRKNAEDRNLH